MLNPSRFFIMRPVGTTLMMLALLLVGALGYARLPASDLPSIDFPVVVVVAQQPGGTPEEVADAVATPLERHLGQIAGVNQITSASTDGSTQIVVQFDDAKDIHAAAHDVEAAIQAARVDLPSTLRSDPQYFEFNPAASPIMVLALTSPSRTLGQMFEAAQTILQRHVLSIPGVGREEIAGSALPAIRVQVDPLPLFRLGLGLEDVRAALASANADAPKGFIDQGDRRYAIETNDHVYHAADYRGLVIGYRNGTPVRLSDVAHVVDGVEDTRVIGSFNGGPAIIAILYPQAGANVIHVIDAIRARLPEIQAELPPDVALHAAFDQSLTIRVSLLHTQITLLVSVALVVLVVLVFMRSLPAVLVPAITVAVAIVASFGAMFALGYSLDTLSLLALIIAVGFVVDDAIVVLENIARHMEAGMNRRQASLLGAQEVCFTVVSITVSLIAVFLPVLLMPGLAGKLLREFAGTMIVTITISMVVSLTLTPMLCSRLLTVRPHPAPSPPAGRSRHALARLWAIIEAGLELQLRLYARSLEVALRHPRLTLLSLPLTIAATIGLVVVIPKGFIPEQDVGLLQGTLQGDASISFQNLRTKLDTVQQAILADPDVESVVAFIGGDARNVGEAIVQLRDKDVRHASDTEISTRIGARLTDMVGAQLFLSGGSIFGNGGRTSHAAYQYTLQSDVAGDLQEWMPRLVQALRARPELRDVSSDLDVGGRATRVDLDRDMVARLGLTPQLVANTLFDMFGQRQVSTIYTPQNQYHVVLEATPDFAQDMNGLGQVWIGSGGGSPTGSATSNTIRLTLAQSSSIVTPAAQLERNSQTNALANGAGTSTGSAVSATVERQVPLAAMTRIRQGRSELTVNHQDGFAAATLSFNLPPKGAISVALAAVQEELVRIRAPASIHGAPEGDAAQAQQAAIGELLVLIGAFALIYITLGILYESAVHPLTVLSTLPSAGAGAVLALWLCGEQFTLIAMLGIVLLIGIVKKNAILMIDFAIKAVAEDGLAPDEAVRRACLLRFRPIIMTTLASALGALPLVLGHSFGSEFRRPLGISIIGGLVVSQALTLYTTPVVYLTLDCLSRRTRRLAGRMLRVAG